MRYHDNLATAVCSLITSTRICSIYPTMSWNQVATARHSPCPTWNMSKVEVFDVFSLIVRLSASLIEISYQFQEWCMQFDHLYQNMWHISNSVSKLGCNCRSFTLPHLKDVKNWGFQGFRSLIMRLSTSPIEISYPFQHWCVQFDHLYQNMPHICKCVWKFGCYCQ